MEEWPLQRYQPSIPLYGEAIDLGRMLLESILIGVNTCIIPPCGRPYTTVQLLKPRLEPIKRACAV